MARNLIDLAYDEDLYDDYLDEEQDYASSKKIAIRNKMDGYPQYDNRRKQEIRSKRREKEKMREQGEYNA